MKTVVVFLADGFEEIEALTPVDYLRRAGVNVSILAVPADGHTDLNVCGAHHITVKADVTLDGYIRETGDRFPDAVVIPGGMPGAANIGNCSQALDFIKKAFERNCLIAAICAAPAVVLAKTGILAGKHYTCYPDMEKQIAKYCGESPESLMEGSVHMTGIPFITDGNLVTSRAPGTAEQFTMELIRLLCGAPVVQKIRESSLLR